jgi:hypothetical protein
MRLSTPLARVTAPALLACLVSIAAGAQDTRTVTGTVRDSGGTGIPYVNIDAGPRFRTLGNAVGEFTLVLPARQAFDISVRRIGFLAGKVRIEPGADTVVTAYLQPLAVLLEGQVIHAREQVRNLAARGFYARMSDRERGSLVGEFVTPEEIEMRNPQRVTQLLEQRRGVWVKRVGRCQIIVQCWRILGANDCVATVFLDGHRLNQLSDAAASSASAAPAIDELVSASSVAGIEVYPRGSSAPPRFQALAGTCSVIVIWTK